MIKYLKRKAAVVSGLALLFSLGISLCSFLFAQTPLKPDSTLSAGGSEGLRARIISFENMTREQYGNEPEKKNWLKLFPFLSYFFNEDPNQRYAIRLNDWIRIEVDDVSKCVSPQDSSIILFLNGVPMQGLKPIMAYPPDNKFTFKLSRDSLSRASWDAFLQYPRKDINNIKIALGNKTGLITSYFPSKHTLIVVPHYSFVASYFITIALFVFFLVLGAKSELLKDLSNHKKKPYSLARVQLVFWTLNILCGYVFVYLSTGELTPITGSTLALLAISSTTAATARLIDSRQAHQKNIERFQNRDSEGFWLDIASDESGIAIHRIQIILWTVVFGLIFIRSVIKQLSMPEFDEGILILMGITNATYLGLKYPENTPKTTENNAVAAPSASGISSSGPTQDRKPA